MNSPKPNRFLNWSIVIATCALVAAPVMYDRMGIELAQWHLAAAANAATVLNTDPEPHLVRAKNSVGDLESMRDYWLFRIKQALVNSPESTPEVLRSAISADVSNAELTGFIATSLWEIEEFEALIEVLEFGRGYFKTVSTSTLNQLAYARALTNLELEEALEDINAAIKVDPNNVAIRDTRGWVLFKMGRPLEAIEDVDFAVKEFEKLERQGWSSRALSWLEQSIPTASNAVAPDCVLTRQEAGEFLWVKGAMIYHRAKILDALGRADEAQQDWLWLKEHNLPQDDRIY